MNRTRRCIAAGGFFIGHLLSIDSVESVQRNGKA